MLKTLIIGCAGAGSNIVGYLKDNLPKKDFVEFLTIDTSSANVKEGIDFIHLKEDNKDEKALSGSGGVRGANMEHVKKGVANFIDSYKLHRYDGIIYLVFSSNGGSGNIIASAVLKEMLEKNISVACIVVHDMTSKQYAGQSLGTIKTINKIALDTGKAIPMIYYNNKADTSDGGNIDEVNKTILEEFTEVIQYNDIENLVDIDKEDMKNFYHPTNYNIIKLPAGIYGISVLKYSALDEVVKKYEIVIGRCLTTDEDDHFRKHALPQYKKGNNLKTNPETMLLLINNFERHYKLLEDGFNQYNKNIEVFKIDTDEDVIGF